MATYLFFDPDSGVQIKTKTNKGIQIRPKYHYLDPDPKLWFVIENSD